MPRSVSQPKKRRRGKKSEFPVEMVAPNGENGQVNAKKKLRSASWTGQEANNLPSTSNASHRMEGSRNGFSSAPGSDVGVGVSASNDATVTNASVDSSVPAVCNDSGVSVSDGEADCHPVTVVNDANVYNNANSSDNSVEDDSDLECIPEVLEIDPEPLASLPSDGRSKPVLYPASVEILSRYFYPDYDPSDKYSILVDTRNTTDFYQQHLLHSQNVPFQMPAHLSIEAVKSLPTKVAILDFVTTNCLHVGSILRLERPASGVWKIHLYGYDSNSEALDALATLLRKWYEGTPSSIIPLEGGMRLAERSLRHWLVTPPSFPEVTSRISDDIPFAALSDEQTRALKEALERYDTCVAKFMKQSEIRLTLINGMESLRQIQALQKKLDYLELVSKIEAVFKCGRCNGLFTHNIYECKCQEDRPHAVCDACFAQNAQSCYLFPERKAKYKAAYANLFLKSVKCVIKCPSERCQEAVPFPLLQSHLEECVEIRKSERAAEFGDMIRNLVRLATLKRENFKAAEHAMLHAQSGWDEERERQNVRRIPEPLKQLWIQTRKKVERANYLRNEVLSKFE